MERIVRIGRHDMLCPFCLQRRWFIFSWTSDGRTVRACVRHTLAAWRFLKWKRKLS